MTDKLSDEAIREACRRLEYGDMETHHVLKRRASFDAILLAASLIEKYEPDTLIDPVKKRAREICVDALKNSGGYVDDESPMMLAIIRALKEGMPK